MAGLHHIKHALRQVVVRNGIANRRRGRSIARFAEKIGFVYFGSVDSHDDEHHVIRGLSASSSHKDTHYSVGSYDGYDISVVERTDLIGPVNNPRSYRFLIFEFRLRQNRDVPHIILTAKGVEDTLLDHLLSHYGTLQEAPLGTLQVYNPEFLHRFSAYSAPTHFLELEQYFNSDVTRYIAAHFWPFSIEVRENSLYLYAIHPAVTTLLLETMLHHGLWLADKIDTTER